MNTPLRTLLGCTLIAATAFASPAALAQAYPVRTVKIVVPAPAAGAIDIVGRVMADRLSKAWGQSVVVDNRAGARGMIGTDVVAKAKPDGYTALIQVAAMVGTPYLFAQMPYDIFKDLAPVSLLASTGLVVAVNANSGIATLEQFVKEAKAHPSRFNFASPGSGSAAHLVGEALNQEAGLSMLHVPHKGEGPMITDLLGGNVSAVVASPAAVAVHVQAGKLRALAISGARRNPLLPNVPTLDELGYKASGPIGEGWIALFLPAGTPKSVVDKFSSDLARILHDPDVIADLAKLGYRARSSTPTELAEGMKTESGHWAAQIKRLGIKPE